LKPEKKLSVKDQIKEDKIKSQRKAILLKSLVPIAKALVLWIILVALVSLDYSNTKIISNYFILFTSKALVLIGKITPLDIELVKETYSKVGSGNLLVYCNLISINKYSMIVELECSAYTVYIAAFCLTLFSRWTWKQKIINLLILESILISINLVRIILLGLVAKSYAAYFDSFHDYVWNILITLIIWLLWEWRNKASIIKTSDV
jgi:exosortase/archaeosortase family protein